MDKYDVLLSPKAYRDLEDIFQYIACEKQSPDNAKAQTARLRKSILSLEFMPYSHQQRTVGKYADRDYRQLLIDNYVAVFKIDEEHKQVMVVTVQYQSRNI